MLGRGRHPRRPSHGQLYALIARETTILCEYTTTSGNFQQITSTILNKIKPEVGTRSHDEPLACRHLCTAALHRHCSSFVQMALCRRRASLTDSPPTRN